MDKEAVQMFAAPIEATLKNLMELGDAGVTGDEQSPPHQRTHAAEKDTKLVDRNGRKGQPCGHFAQAYRYSLEPDPRNLPLSINRKYGNSLRSCKKVRENRVISE